MSGVMHEVLLGLLGYTGGLVVESENGFVLDSADFLTEGERRLVERMLKVGFFCKKLSDFTASVRRRHFAASNDKERRPGHYAYGLTLRIEEALDGFREKVMELESQVQNEPTLTLAYIAAQVDEDGRRLGVLQRLVAQAAAKNLSGAPLLDLLWRAAFCHMGGGEVYQTLWSVVQGTGQVFVNQLVAWMVYGRLIDPDNEFFVCRRRPLPSDLYGEDLSHIDANTAQREWHSHFLLRPEAMPSIVSRQAAQDVLFTGRAVRVLLRSHRWLKERAEDRWEASLQGRLDPATVQNEVDSLRSCLQADASCAGPGVASAILGRSVAQLRRGASWELRQLLLDGDLLAHLHALKGFYLLGYGAFYQTFLDLARPLLRRPPAWNAEQELRMGAWATAAAEEGLEPEAPSAPSTPASARTPRRGGVRGKVQLQMVPKSLELQSFDVRRVKALGSARLDAVALLAPSAGGAQLWLNTRLRMSGSFQHAFGFQVRERGEELGGEFGARFALCFQSRWSPNEIQKGRHGPDLRWTNLGDALALEVTYCVLPHATRSPAREPLAEVTLRVLQCHGAEGEKAQELAAATLSVPELRQINMVRLWYDAEKCRVQVFFGVDAVAPCCACDVDLSESLDVGYAGFCLMALGSEPSSRDRPVQIFSWRHQMRDRAEVEDSGAWFSSLTLSYQVPWPLPLILTSRCLERYNRLFQQLLQLRLAHLELQRVEVKHRLHWSFRSQLMFFVSQLLQFFQQDVVEAAQKKLLDAVEASQSFEEIAQAHEDFLSTLTAHFFLKTPELHKELMTALRIAGVFCQALSEGGGLRDAELQRLHGDFLATTRAVIRMMQAMDREGIGMTHLAQLLLRLDYNNYFSGG
ncbi:unnamed protein product [Effrenium voratum]|uniref:Spindle pole body component n=1 Tax=Effrenium voratum TaxID=2562239 RepID=A0AA36JR11_9DINO|nr:unnamed protein product [Effrenium voratum]